MLSLFQTWKTIGDWPFTAREMTRVHHSFVLLAQVEMNERKRTRTPGAARRVTIGASNGAYLDRAFDALQRRRRQE